MGIFVAVLWPFNFVPKNRIRWLPGRAGLRFDGYGQVHSSAPMFSPRGSDGAAQATIELVFTPSRSYNTASTVFALVNQDEVSFAIGQSLTDLFLRGSFANGTDKPVAKLWIDGVCGRAEELFVTMTLDTRHVDVYLDGQRARSFPVSTRADNLSGRLFVGHNVKDGGQWSGSVARLAIFEGTLDAAGVSRRYEHPVRRSNAMNRYFSMAKIHIALIVLLLSCAAWSQPNVSVFASGFNNPRGLKFGPDGFLYVAEGGTGGGLSTIGLCDQAAGPPAGPGPYTGDFTARISKIAPNGTVSTVADHLPSSQTSPGFLQGSAA